LYWAVSAGRSGRKIRTFASGYLDKIFIVFNSMQAFVWFVAAKANCVGMTPWSFQRKIRDVCSARSKEKDRSVSALSEILESMSVIDLSKIPFPQNDFRALLDSICEKYELDFAAYAGMDPIAQTVHGFVNYPDEWQTRYVKEGFQHKDPTLLTAARSISPVDWQRLRGDASFDTIFQAANDYRIFEQGLTIPVRGPFGDVGLFSVTRDCSDTEWELLKRKILGDLQTAAVHMHDHVMSTNVLSHKLMHPSLSSREKEILQWVAAGKSQQDVADILSISNRTVEVHLRSSRSKLSALTTAQAVGRAIGLGMIYPV